MAGSTAKCEFLKEIGYDAAINYKTEDLDKALTELSPDGVEYFMEMVEHNFLYFFFGQRNLKRRGNVKSMTLYISYEWCLVITEEASICHTFCETVYRPSVDNVLAQLYC